MKLKLGPKNIIFPGIKIVSRQTFLLEIPLLSLPTEAANVKASMGNTSTQDEVKTRILKI